MAHVDLKDLKPGDVVWENFGAVNKRLTVTAKAEKELQSWWCIDVKDDWGKDEIISQNMTYRSSNVYAEPQEPYREFHCLPENIPADIAPLLVTA